MNTIRHRFAVILALPILLVACSDDGDPVAPMGPAAATLVPARTVLGDTIDIRGSGFGAAQGGREVLFTTATGTTAAVIESWSDGEIEATVPANAISGPVVVDDGGSTIASAVFDVAPALVFYANQVQPLLDSSGCTDGACHGSPTFRQGLDLTDRAGILAGSNNGLVVLIRESAASLLIRKVGPNPPGSRMPLGGTALSPTQVLLLADWIDQGARDN